MVAEIAETELCLVKTVGDRGIARRHALHEAELIRRLGNGTADPARAKAMSRAFSAKAIPALSLAHVDVAASGCETSSMDLSTAISGHAGLAPALHLPSWGPPFCSVIQQIR